MVEKLEPGIVVVGIMGEAHCFLRSKIQCVDMIYVLEDEDEGKGERTPDRWGFTIVRLGRHIADRIIYDTEAEAIADRNRVLKFVEEGVVDA